MKVVVTFLDGCEETWLYSAEKRKKIGINDHTIIKVLNQGSNW
jgi:hypothetical protein